MLLMGVAVLKFALCQYSYFRSLLKPEIFGGSAVQFMTVHFVVYLTVKASVGSEDWRWSLQMHS